MRFEELKPYSATITIELGSLKRLWEEMIDLISSDNRFKTEFKIKECEPATILVIVETRQTNVGRIIMQETVRLQIPFASLVDAIASLELEEKQQLWQLLNEEIIQAEEDRMEQDPTVQDEIQEARAAYRAGDYQTLEEYIAQRSKTAS